LISGLQEETPDAVEKTTGAPSIELLQIGTCPGPALKVETAFPSNTTNHHQLFPKPIAPKIFDSPVKYILIIKNNKCVKEAFKKQVRNNGTFGQALQNECMEIWNVSFSSLLEAQDMLIFN